MSALVIDAFEFCRLKERLEGETPVLDLKRLAAECVNPSGALQWSVVGGLNPLGYPQLTLSVAAAVPLICQRCVAPFDFDFASQSIVVLAKSEEQADEIDDAIADDTIDVIVGSRTMNVMELIEDESLLALPLAPKHDVCPGTPLIDEVKPDSKPSPFAVLKNIKQKS